MTTDICYSGLTMTSLRTPFHHTGYYFSAFTLTTITFPPLTESGLMEILSSTKRSAVVNTNLSFMQLTNWLAAPRNGHRVKIYSLSRNSHKHTDTLRYPTPPLLSLQRNSHKLNLKHELFYSAYQFTKAVLKSE